MSINPVILELSQQIAHLQAEYQSLITENQQLKTKSQTKVKRIIQNKDAKGVNPHFLKSVEVLKEKRLLEFEKTYSGELAFIRSRYPRWKPNL